MKKGAHEMLRSDSKFLKLKQEKWARERAEQENTTEWFPFGSNLRPGGGSPLRKFHAKESPNLVPKSQQYSDPETETDNTQNHEEEAEILENEKMTLPNEEHTHHPQMAPFLIPAYFPPNFEFGAQSFMMPPQFHAVPSHAIPVSTINIDPNQICPAELQSMWGMQGPNGIRYGIPIPSSFVHQSMTSSISSNESGISGLTTKRDENQNERKMSTGGYLPTNYEEQIAERLRYEQEELEKEKEEEKIREEQRRELEERRNSEEMKRKNLENQRILEERRRSKQFEEAMEQAKKEAELLKKAKLFKHVLKGAEETGELDEIEKKLLGVDIDTGKRLLKEVSEVERHKKQDEQEIRKNGPVKDDNHVVRSRSMSNASSIPTSPLSRNGFGRRSVRTTSREKQEERKRIQDENHRHLPPHHHQSTSPLSSPTKSDPENPNYNSNNNNSMMKSTVYYRPTALPSSLHQKNEEIGEDLKSRMFLRSTSNLTPSSFNSPARRKNSDELTQSALFGQIPTRLSTRRSMRAPMQIQSPKAGFSRNAFNNGERSTDEEGGSISPEFEINHNDSRLTSENTHPSPDCEIKEFKFRTRSALGSPSSYLNGGSSLMSSRCASPAGGSSRFLQKLEEKGAIKRDEDCLSPSARRVAEENLRRSPSIASLSQSFQNLSNLRGSMLNLSSNGEHSPNLSKLNSMNSPACQSLRVRMQKTSDRQVAVLDRLSRLRESLNAGKALSPATSRVAPITRSSPLKNVPKNDEK